MFAEFPIIKVNQPRYKTQNIERNKLITISFKSEDVFQYEQYTYARELLLIENCDIGLETFEAIRTSADGK